MDLSTLDATYLWILAAPPLMVGLCVVVFALSRLMTFLMQAILRAAGGG